MMGFFRKGKMTTIPHICTVHTYIHIVSNKTLTHNLLVDGLFTYRGQRPFDFVGAIVYIDIWFYLQPGTFDLVGTIVYEIDQVSYQNTFYNGTIEVSEAGGFVSVETVFLVSLGLALLVLGGLWVRTQLQLLSKVKVTYLFGTLN